MTIHTKRRGRRSLAAILAAMLMASVLAVVAGSPAQAANTAYEVYGIDSDNDGVNDEREFAGSDRYGTALKLATNFAKANGGLGAVPNAFLASGETLVDSISGAGLAGYLDAPILLTPGDSLHPGVADFIEDYDVRTVHVLGGPVAVSDAVIAAVEALPSKPTVPPRLAGPDRYGTAAAAAAGIKTASTWCGGDDTAAVLINGTPEAMPYGVAVQTTAFRLQLPVLMTEAGELPQATADAISDLDIEHVQIMGNTDVVSAEVEAAVSSLGVTTVRRTDGDSAAAVSVALAELANNGCGDDLAPVSTSMVALVRGNPDGVAAAPVLASSLDSGSLVTPLIVEVGTLPSVVSEYLAKTDNNIGANKTNLGIVAIGGEAAVTPDVMTAAKEAATSTSEELTVSIIGSSDTNNNGVTNTTAVLDAADEVQAGDTVVWLSFSDAVISNDASATPPVVGVETFVRDVLEVDDVPAQISAVTSANVGCDTKVAKVTLTKALKKGSTVSVTESALKFGAGGDRRSLQPASVPVKAKATDSVKPQAKIIGIAGGVAASDGTTAEREKIFTVRITDNAGLKAMDANAIVATDFIFHKATGSHAQQAIAETDGVTHDAVTAGDKSVTVTVTMAQNIVKDEKLYLKENVVSDLAGNKNARSKPKDGVNVIKAQASPKVIAVEMSKPKHRVQAQINLDEDFDSEASPDSDSDTFMEITAKATGAAAGAIGNAWTFRFDRHSEYSAAKATDIDVRVAPKLRLVSVRFVNGKATFADLKAELDGNEAFAALFDADIDCGDEKVQLDIMDGDSTDDLDTPVALGATSTGWRFGITEVAIEATFNGYVQQVEDDALLDDILAGVVARRTPDLLTTAAVRTALDLESSDLTDSTDPKKTFVAPGTVVRYEAGTTNAAAIPQADDDVDVKAGAQAATDANNKKAGNQARSAVAAVAIGYAPDDPGAFPDETRNGANQVEIEVSDDVKMP